MVTAGTYGKELFFNSPEKSGLLHETLLLFAKEYGWNLQAWAVLGNHYHFVALSSNEPETLRNFISDVNRITATKLNAIDRIEGRKVWYQYWDSHITYQKSYWARLKYVRYNPVHHGIVDKAEDYKWCSAAWFDKTAEDAFRKTVMGFGMGRIKVMDEF